MKVFYNELERAGFKGQYGLGNYSPQYTTSRTDGSVLFVITITRELVSSALDDWLRADDNYVYIVGRISADLEHCVVDLGRLIYSGKLKDFLVEPYTSESITDTSRRVVGVILDREHALRGGFYDITVVLQTGQTFEPVRDSIGMSRVYPPEPMFMPVRRRE